MDKVMKRLEDQLHIRARFPRRGQPGSVASGVRGSGQITVSFRQRCQFPLSIGCESKTRADVLGSKIRKLLQKLLLGHPACQVFQNIRNRHSGSANAWFAASLSGFDSYDSLIVHTQHLSTSLNFCDKSGLIQVRTARVFTAPGRSFLCLASLALHALRLICLMCYMPYVLHDLRG